MRTTITIDDDLLAEAQKLTGVKERPRLVQEALKALIAREHSARLIKLGGTQPGLKDIPRRRPSS